MRFLIFFFLYAPFLAAYADKCGVNVEFKSIPKVTERSYQVADNVEMFTKGYLAYQNVKSAKMATNITCQLLSGTQYQATEQEWQSILKANFTNLSKQGYEELKLTPLEGKNKYFHGDEQHREYRFDVSKDDFGQVFYIVNILNKQQTTLYSVMISGDSSIAAEIEVEYQRILASLVLPDS